MTIYEAMEKRHAVRSYENKEIEADKAAELKDEINRCNQEGNLAIQLIINDREVFKGMMAFSAGFRGVSNYIALVGPAGDKLDEKLGYYGERIALRAQQLGLNTCWVGATWKKGKCRAAVGENQELVCVLALGYGTTQGVPHKTKPMSQLCKTDKDMPDWFKTGMEAVMLAPTAMNKQNFQVILDGEDVRFQVKESRYSKIDMGIIKYHFDASRVYRE